MLSGAQLQAAAFGAALLFPPKEAEAESSDIPNGVSVIVPVLNESKTITQTLRYLKLLEPQPLEVIVVDGGSTDG